MESKFKCPKCGSTNTRDSYVKDCSRFACKVTAKFAVGALSCLPFADSLARNYSYAAGKAGDRIGGAIYCKRKCLKCGHTWFYDEDIFRS